MEVRNGTYTIYNGNEFELSRNALGNYVLYFRGIDCPDKTFKEFVSNIFQKVISNPKEITNAFSVSTYASYKGFRFQLDIIKGDNFRLSSGDYQAYTTLKLNMIDRGWYEIWVEKSSVERVWEERKESGYNLPFSSNIDRIKEIL